MDTFQAWREFAGTTGALEAATVLTLQMDTFQA
jgi:hypothetical protein